MKKFLIALIGAVLYIATGEAQDRARDLYTISGQVIDSLANEAVPYATVGVAFAQAPTQYVKAAACDGNGKFEIEVKTPGSYVMTIQSIGKTTLLKPFVLAENNKKVDLGKLYVQEKTQVIDEVTIAAQKPLVKVEIDKIIYNMEEDPEAKVNNTLEMLRKVPMVTVDGDDNVQLKGSSNFKVYLDGKPSNMLSGQNLSQVLKSMPANSVKNIEVITDPGAKYDAEGIGGIINIVTVRNTFQGFQGTVTANAGTFGGVGGGTYLTAKTGKLGITGNFNLNKNQRPWGDSESVSENYINDQYYRENRMGRSKNTGNFMSGNLEASYEFDTLNLLSLGANLWGGNFKSLSEQTIEMFDKAGGMEYSYERDSEGKDNFGSTGVNLDYQRSTHKKGENFTFSYRFNNSPNDNENHSYASNIAGTLPSHMKPTQWNDNDAKTTEHTAQVDYVNPITKEHSIEAGLKYILRQNTSNVKQYELDADGGWQPLPAMSFSDFAHTSNIYAGYAGYAYKAKKVGFRTGLRAEGTRQDVKFSFDDRQNFDLDYFNWVPSITASYQLKPTQQLRIGYNLRIYRPGIWYLNPYVNDTDPYNISYGNPDLKPEKSNSFNLNYSYFSPKYTLNVSANYSYVNNSIERYTFIDETAPTVKRSTYGNIGRNQRVGVYVNAGWTPNKVLRVNLNGGLNYTDLKSAELDAANSGLNGNVYLNAQVSLPKDFRINVYGMYYSGWIMLEGKQSSQYFTNIAVNKDFLKKKLTVSLSCTNPINKKMKYESSTANEYLYSNTISRYPAREGRISISYRFGSMKGNNIKKVQRSISNDDVKGGGSGESSGGGGGGGM